MNSTITTPPVAATSESARRESLSDRIIQNWFAGVPISALTQLADAAPDLLEACKQLLTHGLKGADDKRLVLMACKRDVLNAEELESAERLGKACDMARAAVAKAEGRPSLEPTVTSGDSATGASSENSSSLQTR